MAAFSVDRLYNPKVIDEQAVPKPKDFNVNDYENKIFKMFNGEDVMVEFECDNFLMKYIIDHYGLDIETKRNTEETFIVKVPATISPTFYGWVFQFAGHMKIISPDIAIEQLKTMAESFI